MRNIENFHLSGFYMLTVSVSIMSDKLLRGLIARPFVSGAPRWCDARKRALKFPCSSTAAVLPKEGGGFGGGACLSSPPRSRNSRRRSASCMISELQWKGWRVKNRRGERIKRMWQLWGVGMWGGDQGAVKGLEEEGMATMTQHQLTMNNQRLEVSLVNS